ncbi:hypothetical protein M2650_14210 [Luteimonas sp. SX5]|uniref:Uncharacterized protein n=1 Tax=Luteimonas galliterrae TaxID=2940486 RepID=A0ABT0MLK9_9GAMM|nr:hypothetical protein [Luteimonas galliterrae]MCL1635780.1 hypothetical protein [Luteimonas galliterrae]
MRPIRTVALAALLPVAVVHAGPETHGRYLTLVNREYESVISLEIAGAGSEAFRELPLAPPLAGGGGSTTVRIAVDGCRHDLRFVFKDGRRLLYRDVDVCRYDRLRIRGLPHGSEDGQAVAGSPSRR